MSTDKTRLEKKTENWCSLATCICLKTAEIRKQNRTRTISKSSFPFFHFPFFFFLFFLSIISFLLDLNNSNLMWVYVFGSFSKIDSATVAIDVCLFQVPYKPYPLFKIPSFNDLPSSFFISSFYLSLIFRRKMSDADFITRNESDSDFIARVGHVSDCGEKKGRKMYGLDAVAFFFSRSRKWSFFSISVSGLIRI